MSALDQAPVAVIELGARRLPETLPLVSDAIERTIAGEAIDLTTEQEVVVKYVVPTAALRGVKVGFRSDPQGGWRVELRPRVPPSATGAHPAAQ